VSTPAGIEANKSVPRGPGMLLPGIADYLPDERVDPSPHAPAH
jgi:hypothetical protein